MLIRNPRNIHTEDVVIVLCNINTNVSQNNVDDKQENKQLSGYINSWHKQNNVCRQNSWRCYPQLQILIKIILSNKSVSHLFTIQTETKEIRHQFHVTCVVRANIHGGAGAIKTFLIFQQLSQKSKSTKCNDFWWTDLTSESDNDEIVHITLKLTSVYQNLLHSQLIFDWDIQKIIQGDVLFYFQQCTWWRRKKLKHTCVALHEYMFHFFVPQIVYWETK